MFVFALLFASVLFIISMIYVTYHFSPKCAQYWILYHLWLYFTTLTWYTNVSNHTIGLSNLWDKQLIGEKI